MQDLKDIDDNILGEFVDNELDSASRAHVLEAMKQNASVRERIQQMRRAKDYMKLGFGGAKASVSSEPVRSTRHWRLDSLGLAASVLILITGLGLGYFGHSLTLSGNPITPMAQQHADRVLLHISESDPKKFKAVLDYARNFLETNKQAGRQVAVIAHSSGLDMLRDDISPYKQEILDMIRDYNNIHFIACANSIRALRKKGIEPKIIDHIDTSLPAMEQIINHVRQGWSYIKVNSLPAV